MKKILYTITIFVPLLINAQELSFGPIIGLNSYDIEVDGPLTAEGANSSLNFGGFLDYNFKNNFGIRGNILYNSVTENGYSITENGIGSDFLFEEAKYNAIQIQGLLKYDVNEEYNKGFYLIGGLRMSAILSAESNNEDIKDFYNSTSFGVMLGFGVNFLKYFGVELIPDYNITNTIDSNDNKSKNFGAYLNLTFNLKPLLN
jgi:hypothetical protein